ncbi:GNAT family N-acetyltransferase [Veronia nyctiphanis]|uniref:GNAT family N-acetyltransferase n=1 Tax=Veronia nyctiphanis TaxID=1278244 RepID=A0A4Q0YDZ3_9GAMM|nr:GNAT family N-acetyltransferase [Veronia nyctiphanis]RXJ68700.1 GNAT family N-acetyltransferase [Veronia nyctiphanis]
MAITIRHAVSDDLAAIHEIYACPSAQAFTTQLPFPKLATWEKRINQDSSDSYFLVAESEGIVVGHATLWLQSSPRRRHVASIGMAVHDEHSGKGIGSSPMEAVITLADKWLNIRRIELEVFSDNISAITLYRKFGFEVEGEAKDFAFKDGQFVSALYMSRINAN